MVSGGLAFDRTPTESGAAVYRCPGFPPSGELRSQRLQVRALPGALRSSSEGLRPSDSPTRSLARRFAGALRSRGSLAALVRAVAEIGLTWSVGDPETPRGGQLRVTTHRKARGESPAVQHGL